MGSTVTVMGRQFNNVYDAIVNLRIVRLKYKSLTNSTDNIKAAKARIAARMCTEEINKLEAIL